MTMRPITGRGNCFVTVDDPDAALGFYRDVLGFTVKSDVSNGSFRCLTLTTPQQPELESAPTRSTVCATARSGIRPATAT